MIANIIIFFTSIANKIEIIKSILLFFIAILNSLMQLFFIVCVYSVINFFLQTDPSTSIEFLSFIDREFSIKEVFFLAFVALFISLIFQFVYNFFSNKWLTNFVCRLEKEIFEKNLNKKLFYLNQKTSHEYIKKIIDNVPRLSLGIFLPTINIFVNYFIIFLYLSFLIKINFKITLIILSIMSLLSLIIYYIVKKKLINLSDKENFYLNYRIKLINNSLNYFRDIKIYNLNNIFKENFFHYSSKYFQTRYWSYFFSSFSKVIFEFSIFFILLLTIFFILILVKDNYSAYFTLLNVYILVLYKLLPSFINLLGAHANISSNFKFFQIIKKEYKSLNKNSEEINFINYYKRKLSIESIQLKKISFCYNSRFIFKDLDLNLKKGDNLVLLGLTGSGKSTLLDILSGLIQANSGQFIINSKILIKQKNLKMLRNKVSYVSQNSEIFEDSIYNNITLKFHESISNKEISNDKLFQKIIKITQVDSILKKKNISLKKKLLERGRNLSGGEKQRIFIARALYKNHDILIMDEATNAINSKMESQLIKNLIKHCKEKIFILCTHNDRLKNLFNKNLNMNKVNTIYK